MSERIVFTDIEATLVSYLANRLAAVSDTAEVVTVVPDPAPARLVRISRDDRKGRMDREDRDGFRGAHLILDRPRIILECGDSSGAAAELASTVRSILSSAAPGYIGTVWCDHLEDVGLEHTTDPVTAAPRYVITTDLVVRGTVAD
ncbi:hypothetical protein AB0H71_09910 [Nocardia sp. NPDC050697]|uniref:hypothetical protein n=1 Tax=Nocardia sp. NPDC050697 TaxID=3155158 RepID=UPI00340FAFDD